MKKLIIIIMIVSSNILFASVNSMIDVILKHEGSTLEKGGGSKYGITQETLHDYGYKIPVSKVNKGIAKNIYKKWFYEYFPSNINDQVKKILMPLAFDTSINMGHLFAEKTLVNSANGYIARLKMEGKKISYVSVDSVYHFLNTLEEYELREINNMFVGLRVDKYVSLAKQSKFAKYKNGWLKRSKSFLID